MKEFNWKQASEKQLMNIAYEDRECPIACRIYAGEELKRRAAAKRANIKYKAMGRNWG
ncbi:hypothetical protein [Paenibacillus sp. MBLB4367]|uniref:hypothetical protein n=1 Tax=Paenibacillus sp. MBLB4367 TaxID=3384767 RepID=UPI0039082C7E